MCGGSIFSHQTCERWHVTMMGMECGYAKGFGEKNIVFRWKYFQSIKKWSPSLSSNWAGKWDFYEEYGGLNLGEKFFKYFKFYIIFDSIDYNINRLLLVKLWLEKVNRTEKIAAGDG
jgi:hypothetical protein